MALPKRKTSKARRDKRRSHTGIHAPLFNLCPNCQEPILAHHMCRNCGHYRGRQVVEITEKSE
ncbi:MAG: 50S ribosomal protein L32 [bacterium]